MSMIDRIAISSYNTKLNYFDDATSKYVQLCPVKNTPALGGKPEQIDITTLDNKNKAYILGIQEVEAFEFDANYTPAEYRKAYALANQDHDFLIGFGNEGLGEQGMFKFTGQMNTYPDGAEVNGAIPAKLSITASTDILHVESIAITTAPTTTAYDVGDDFDKTGMVVTVTWDDGTTETFGSEYIFVEDGKSLQTSDVLVHIAVGGCEATQLITVTA